MVNRRTHTSVRACRPTSPRSHAYLYDYDYADSGSDYFSYLH
ncbi:hypothetical protein [Micromonospora sp. KC723]|nr:hypothetical protein [Micromonospora sp. KC723]